MCDGGIAQSAYKICVKIFLRPLHQLHPVKILVLGDFSFKLYRIVVLDRCICRCAYIHVCVENALGYNNYSQYRTNRFESELLENAESHSQNIQCRKSAEDNQKQYERLRASPQCRNIRIQVVSAVTVVPYRKTEIDNAGGSYSDKIGLFILLCIIVRLCMRQLHRRKGQHHKRSHIAVPHRECHIVTRVPHLVYRLENYRQKRKKRKQCIESAVLALSSQKIHNESRNGKSRTENKRQICIYSCKYRRIKQTLEYVRSPCG